MIGPCAKQTVVAIIVKNGRAWVGTNACTSPQEVCPRAPGEGYEKCRKVCGQPFHAEVDAIMNAGRECSGAVMYLFGHTYACEHCQTVAKHAGIKQIIILGEV
jgi:deoxycytidylate deaminase